MKRAIEKAIYYIDVDKSINTVIEFEYSDEKSFQHALKNFYNNIEVVVTFNKEDFSPIFETLLKMYSTLLLNKTTSLYIINRQDMAIKLSRLSEQSEDKPRIGILKTDAILSEYSVKKYSPFLFGAVIGSILPIFYLKFISD